ncbi:hypothetical protein PMAYCL1PPCAC_10251, partial [Pristionchus mayeri]
KVLVPMSSVQNSITGPYSTVRRFKYSKRDCYKSCGSDCQAIQFKTVCDINLIGIGLFGGGELKSVSAKIFCLQDGNESERVEIATSTEKSFDTLSKGSLAPIVFDQSVKIISNTWYTISINTSQDVTIIGNCGRNYVTVHGVNFEFRDSKLSFGTSVHYGQIPEIYFEVPAEMSNDPNSITVPCSTVRRFERNAKSDTW